MRALDLFCGAAGAALGLHAAGYETVGVDINPKCAAWYPGHFIQGDALAPPVRLADFDLIWASPPCQAFSVARYHHTGKTYPDLIDATRALLAGHPRTVIENVPGAPIRADVVLTGPSVGLPRLLRRRHFELSWWPGLMPPPMRPSVPVVSVYGGTAKIGANDHQGVAVGRSVMGVAEPVPMRYLSQMVPPRYAELIASRAKPAVWQVP